jgi:hypothetical protein
VTLRRVVIGLLLALGVGLFLLSGRYGVSDDSPQATDSAVEQLIPGDKSPNVPRQSEIGIDLATGWTAKLNINGFNIPEDQLRRNEPLNQVFFTPGEGKEIEVLRPGPVFVIATIWRPDLSQTEADGRQVRWAFTVT